jgi:hypothetical protein
MDYQVPQFIDVEDKIFGPLTLKQFIYLAGGAGLCGIILLYLPLILAILVALPVGALALALAFYKMNGKNFIEILEAGFNYYIGRRLYLWKKEKPTTPTVVTTSEQTAAPVPPTQGLSRKKLEDLAWSLDVKDTGNPDKL